MIHRWAAVCAVLWSAAVGYVSLVPRPPQPAFAGLLPAGVWPLAAHFAMYAVLGGLIALALRSSKLSPTQTTVASIGIPLVYGGALELLQQLVPNRFGSWYDAVANTAGAASAVILVAALAARSRRWSAAPRRQHAEEAARHAPGTARNRVP